MTKIFSTIPDCYIIQPTIHKDVRGSFSEIYTETIHHMVQSNVCVSNFGTLRGIHRTPYGKFIICIQGQVFDVCVDLRPNSPTYNQHYSVILDGTQYTSIYIPPYCGHAVLSLTDSILVYQQEKLYDSTQDESFCYLDFDIQWPIKPIYVSDRDSSACQIK